jgi:hypothetical protein
MAIGSMLAFLALLIVVALFVSRPLIDAEEEDAPDGEESHWTAERERVLDALAELDADWQLNKIPEDVYHAQRAALVAEGAHALEQLERVSVPAKPKRASGDDLESVIAAHKRKRRK